MQRTYSTLIIPTNSTQLIFSIKCDNYLYHCWKNTQKNKFVVMKESNNLSIIFPNQIMNFSETELKRYLLIATNQLNRMDDFLFFNEVLWKRYFDSNNKKDRKK